MTKVMLSCGEPSGDLYAGALADELYRLEPGLAVFGLGGARLRAAGATLVGDYAGLTVTGLTEAVSVLPRSLGMYRRLVAAARAERPDVLVVIDFPDFNFRLARSVARLGVPVVYYVPPQIWAWRGGRLRTIKGFASRVLVIFPFEEALYRRAGVEVEFVGHPLLELARATAAPQEFLAGLGLDPATPTVALLPGSRPNEIRALAPVFADACGLIAARLPGGVQFVVARAPNLDPALFAPLSSVTPRPASVEARTDDVLGAADVVLTCSGTATIQTAIHGKPMVVMYRVSPLSYHLGKRFVRVDTYGMANLVAGRRVVPELIQDDLTPEAVTREALGFLTDPGRAARAREGLREVRSKLGVEGASLRAAKAVLEVAARRR
jgi:lipid-A-disaccharide synthase